MKDYVIMTDSSCDIRPGDLEEWGVESAPLTFRKADDEKIYSNDDMGASEFFNEMREGTVFQTSAVNPDAYEQMFSKAMEAGKEILYIGFSSGLSSTCNSASIAAGFFAEKYPDQRIVIFDTLSASAGMGMLVYFAAERKKAGASLDEVLEFLQKTAPKLCHWFTVDDLEYLKRGGRIGSAAAFAATVLDIKPVMHMDDAGHLVGVSKARGRKQAFKALADKYAALADDPENGIYFFSHADCLDEVKQVEALIEKKYGHKASYIADVGAVIGAHCGPGTIALFFVGKER